jgi:hypothetical protein
MAVPNSLRFPIPPTISPHLSRKILPMKKRPAKTKRVSREAALKTWREKAPYGAVSKLFSRLTMEADS